MNTAADFLKPVIPQALPGVLFFHGTLSQLDTQLNALPTAGQAVCLNNSQHFAVSTTKTGYQQNTETLTLVLCIKSHPAWDQEQRNLLQRITRAWALLLPAAFETAGAKVLGNIQGDTFFNLFSANVDGCQVTYQLELPDMWDPCSIVIPAMPALPVPTVEELLAGR
jgi:hypothetical protein